MQGSYSSNICWSDSCQLYDYVKTIICQKCMDVYFFEKSLSFPCIVFKIFKFPQYLSPKLGYVQKTMKNLQKNEEKIQKSKIRNKKQEKISYFRGNFAKVA